MVCDNIDMKIERLMNLISYGAKLVRPAGVSAVRWSAMIKRAKKDLEIL
jgi:hypothetical protein